MTASLLPAGNGRPERVSLNLSYLSALEAAGLVPIVLAPGIGPASFAAILRSAQGLVLTGGGDLDPRLYGEDPAGTDMNSVSAARDDLEWQALAEADRSGLPVLAICRGMQVLNVARGGSLHQDISGHAQTSDGVTPRDALTHGVRLEPRSCLAGILGDALLRTNSMHHQAVNRLGTNLVMAGWSEDGTIEALTEPGERFVVGVQWHPEELATAQEHARRLFAAFALACGAGR